MIGDPGELVDPYFLPSDLDWAQAAWEALPERSRLILRRRLAGETFDQVGESLTPTLTRERVRQIQDQSHTALRRDQASEAPHLPEELEAAETAGLVISTPQAQELMKTNSEDACGAVLAALGYKPAHGWSGELRGYWSLRPAHLRERLEQLVALAPLTHAEAEDAARDIGLPDDPSWRALLDDTRSRVVRHDLGWFRRARATRDVAYLWLKTEGEPRTATEIAAVVGCSDQAARENMRRDPDFAQLRPEGTWTLSDWKVPGANQRYSSAVDVVVEVLRDLGPLEIDQLRVEVQQRYPVTNWRIQQCLSSNLIGRQPDGRFDLTERGAITVEDDEPRQPPNIKSVGAVVGITLPVNHDLMRGSGLPVNRWLTWRLGLRTAPSTRHFELADGLGTVRVTRATSNSQISSLRPVALNLGLAEGCTLALILHTDTNVATVSHTCAAGQCASVGR